MNHRISLAVTTDGSKTLNGTINAVGSSEIALDELYPVGADQPITLALTVAQLQSLVIVADQNCTFETISPTSPTDSIPLVANAPLVWAKVPNYFPCPFTANVTIAYLTTAVPTRLKYKFLTN